MAIVLRPAAVPFPVGERLVYGARYGPFSVGTATMEVAGIDTVRGVEAVHFVFLIDGGALWYHIHQNLESWVGRHDFRSRRFLNQTEEKGKTWERKFEIYPDSGFYREAGRDTTTPTVPDPLDDAAFLYWIRTVPLEVGKRYEYRRYFRPERNPVIVEVLKRERVGVAGKKWNAIVVRPRIPNGGGIFAEKADARMWLSDDSLHIMLALQSKFSFGQVTLSGSAAIHDFELAAYGGTSEDVAAGLADGTFGMAEETGREMNAAIGDGAGAGKGMGEALVDYLTRRPQLAARDVSVLLAAGERAIPVTVHATLGADIIHQHPAADGAALGAPSHPDFKRLAASLPTLHDGGVVLNVGSAVVMPEVFLKALTVARNLSGGKPTGFTACDCDMQRHYRPRMNVVERPTLAGGRGIQLTGHHEILIPLLAWAVIRELDAR